MSPRMWKEKKLNEILKKKISNGVFNDPKLVGSGVKLINVVDLYSGFKISTNNLSRIDLSQTEIKKYSAQQGDLFFTRSSLKLEGIAQCAIFDSQEQNVVYDCHIMRASPDLDIVHPKFLYEYCLSSRARKHFMRFATTGTMTTINQAGIESLKVPIPPVSEQIKIAEILSTWDRSIEATERLLENSKKRKKALMQQLLTGKKRLPGFKQPWSTTKLSTLCEIRRGASPRPISDPSYFSDSGRGWVRISDVTSDETPFFTKTSQYLSPLGESKSVKVDDGDLIMSICATIGVPKFVKIPACIHDGFVVFRNPSDSLSLNLLYYVIQFITDKLDGEGQPGTQRNLNTSIVGEIQFPKIPVEEQEIIAEIFKLADASIGVINERLKSLRKEKDALMQQLLTGKKRVKVEEAA